MSYNDMTDTTNLFYEIRIPGDEYTMKTKNLKVSFNAPVTLSFVFVSFVVLAAGILTGGKITQMLFMTWHSALLNPLTWLRFFTHVLGHAGWQHYVGNMSYILLLGPMLEEKYGSQRILEVIAVTALITGVVNYILFPSSALCGASGIVFAFILLTSFTNFRYGEIPLTFILVAIVFIGQQIAEGLFLADNISQFTHILGGIVGAVTGYALSGNTKAG